MKITIVGSTKYIDEFNRLHLELALKGHMVFRIATVLPRGEDGQQLDTEVKRRLDLVYKRLIMESEAIVVINKDGYEGEGTMNEIEWARLLGKSVYYSGTDMPLIKDLFKAR